MFKAKTVVSIITFLIMIIGVAPIQVNQLEVKATDGSPVHNLDTGLNYTSIQAAINADETLTGHTLFVEEGVYTELVTLSKSLSLVGENRSTTVIDGNDTGTVVEIAANGTSLSGFTIQGSNTSTMTSGIYIAGRITGCNISCNIIQDNGKGIEFGYYCGNNTVSDNIVASNPFGGIEFSYFAFNNTIRRNIISNSDDNGIYFWDWGGNNIIENNTILSVGGEGIRIVSGEHVVVKGNWVHNSSAFGIFLEGSNCRISHNNVTDSSGISLRGVNNVAVNNRVLNGHRGISIADSCNNTIINNTVMHATAFGITVGWYCSNNTIQKNEISDCGIAVHLERSDNNTILLNNISKSEIGIYISGAGNNTILGNTISSSGLCGLNLVSTSNNLFIHNNIISNDWQAIVTPTYANSWNSNLEGNFWSNYTGTDLNNDGIGDSPHAFDASNVDYYPLMGMFSSFNTSLAKHVNVISNSSLESFLYFESNHTIRMYVSNMTANQTHGFVRICIPHALMTEPYNITVNGANPTYWNYTLHDNGTHRWIYFAYEHSTLEIVIVHESLLLILPLFLSAILVVALVYKQHACKPQTRLRYHAFQPFEQLL